MKKIKFILLTGIFLAFQALTAFALDDPGADTGSSDYSNSELEDTTAPLVTDVGDVYLQDPGAGNACYYQQSMGKQGMGSSGVGLDGAATYSYPMGDVNLIYSSTSGWHIAGGSIITRSTKKGVPDYSVYDTFELGGEELIYVRKYGFEAGGEIWEYRTKRDNGCRVFYHCHRPWEKLYWTVQRPDGSTAWYGQRSDGTDPAYSRMLATGGPNNGKVKAWGMAEEQNRGVYSVKYFDYSPYFFDGKYYLSDIYTHKKDSEGYTKTSIVYFYFQKYGKTSYRRGCLERTKYYPLMVINSIKNKNDASWKRLNGYKIFHDEDYDMEWRVKKIIPFGTDINLELNPVTFDYYDSKCEFSASDDPAQWTIVLGSFAGFLQVKNVH
ncbi:MAG: hypothetical protein JW969_18010 [Spirochaetales bacterium]|nr:hypothetical protein [Spirochaetales bacterium]